MTASAPGGDRLDDVAAGAHAAVGDRRNALLLAGGGGFQHGGELRHADPGDHPRGADAAGPDADLHRVHAGRDQCQRAFGRGDIAGDHLHGVGGVLIASTARSTPCEWPCAVSTTMTSASASISARARASPSGPDAGSRGDAQPAKLVLVRQRMEFGLVHVLDGDQADAAIRVIDHQQLLDAVLVQQPPRLDRARHRR